MVNLISTPLYSNNTMVTWLSSMRDGTIPARPDDALFSAPFAFIGTEHPLASGVDNSQRVCHKEGQNLNSRPQSKV